MKKCPYCAEDIQEAAIKCKHCGQWLNKESISRKVSNAKDIIIDQVKKDFNRAEYNAISVEKSITGWVFIVGGGFIGLVILGLLTAVFGLKFISATAITGGITGVWFGRTLHEWVKNKINKVKDGKAVKFVETTSPHHKDRNYTGWIFALLGAFFGFFTFFVLIGIFGGTENDLVLPPLIACIVGGCLGWILHKLLNYAKNKED